MRKINPLPPIEYLRECFDLNHITGDLTWRIRPNSHFKTDGDCSGWNARYAGRVSGNSKVMGYLDVTIDGVAIKLHRVVYALAYGKDPGQFYVDHVDGNPCNNRPDNLRLATPSQNVANQPLSSMNNFSGIRGVYWNRKAKQWQAGVSKNGKSHYLGTFANLSEAAAVVKDARKALYGEFAYRGVYEY